MSGAPRGPRSTAATRLVAGLGLVWGAFGCLPDNPRSAQLDDTGGDVSGGMFACETADCRLVIVSQTLDDRVDVYEVGDEAFSWRGSVGVDLKTNPGGDISGTLLDEPLDLAWTAGGLEVIVGHYPSVLGGSLLRMEPEALSSFEAGEVVDTATWWRGANPIDGVSLGELEAFEPVAMIELAPDRKLVVVFNNDLFEPESGWDGATELLLVDGAGPPARVALSELLGGDCRGGWGVTSLGGDRVAVACDGDEGVAILDVRGAIDVAQSVDAAADTITGCFADIAFDEKRVRHVAPDGEGGVVVTESPSIATGEDARIWRFDASCSLTSLGTLPGPEVWDLRQIVFVPGTEDDPRWLLARGRTDARGVYVLTEGAAGLEICGELTELRDVWSGGAEVIDPVALAAAADGDGFVVTAGPTDYANAAPGYGRVAWFELDGDDACTAAAAVRVLSDAAPPVDAAQPSSWSRGPNEVIIVEP